MNGKIISVTGTRHQQGITTIGIALARTLQVYSSGKVVLVDINSAYFDMSEHLMLDECKSIDDLLNLCLAEIITPDNIEHHLIKDKHSEIFVCPGSSARTLNHLKNRVELLQSLLEQLKIAFDYIIVDTVANTENPVTKAALRSSEHIIFVASHDDIVLNSTMKSAKTWPGSQVVINKYDPNVESDSSQHKGIKIHYDSKVASHMNNRKSELILQVCENFKASMIAIAGNIESVEIPELEIKSKRPLLNRIGLIRRAAQ